MVLVPRETRDLLEHLASRFGSIICSPVLHHTLLLSYTVVEPLCVDVRRVCLVLLELLARVESPETE